MAESVRSEYRTASWSATDTNVHACNAALRRLRAPGSRRIAAFTIVAFVDDVADANAVRSALRDLARRHPARALVVVRLPAEAPGIDAEVGLVARAHRGISAVCFEDVVLRVRGDAALGLRAVIDASAHRGLPLIAWSYGRLPAPDESLLAMVDRLLVDSARTETIAGLRDLLALSRRIPTTDLAWVALEPWRDAATAVLAGRGGPPAERSIRGIEIHGELGLRVLLAAWLTSRFALEPEAVRFFEAERLAMHIWARHDDRDAHTLISDNAIQRDAADHRGTVTVAPLSPLEVLDRALANSRGDTEWERTLTRALELSNKGVG
jgi:hypothetical protein